jgi:hypothetical protein
MHNVLTSKGQPFIKKKLALLNHAIKRFYSIMAPLNHFSEINPKLKRPPIRIDERSLRLLTTAEKR